MIVSRAPSVAYPIATVREDDIEFGPWWLPLTPFLRMRCDMFASAARAEGFTVLICTDTRLRLVTYIARPGGQR